MTVAAASTQNSQAALYAAINGSGSSSASSSTSLQQMQNNFLTLLTTQLQHQDPTNPMDNAQITTQLAQMSTVQGISQLNGSMTSLLSQYQTASLLQGSSLVGHNVMAAGSQLALGTAGAAGGVDLATAADTVRVDILDANGVLQRSLNLGQQTAGFARFTWDGKDTKGQALPTGQYSFKVTATAGGNAVTATAYSLGSVQSVSLLNGMVNAEVSGLGVLGMDQIKQVF